MWLRLRNPASPTRLRPLARRRGDTFQKLYRYTDEVVCCFDGDNAGRQAAWKALENALPTLTEMRQLKLVFLPDGEDPDSLIRAQGKKAFLQFAWIAAGY